MKILHICTIRAEANGVYLVLKNLIREQRKLGNDVRVINVCEKGVRNSDFEYSDNSRFEHFINEFHPDIVVFHGIFYKQVILFSYLLRKKHIPYLIELHGAQSKENNKKSHLKKKLINLVFLNHVIRKAKGLIYLNKQEQENSTVNHLAKKIFIIPNGCEPTSSVALHHPKEKKKFLYLSRINRVHKGLDYLIPAVKEAAKEGCNLHLSIYGRESSPEDLEWLKNEIQGCEGVIDFYGTVYGKEKEDAFINSDFFILTSRYEGFPIAILEAWSYGLPCIITPGTNVADLIQENDCGFVSPLNVDSLKKSIMNACAMSSTDVKRISKNCIDLANNFSWEEIGKTSIAAYKEIIE